MYVVGDLKVPVKLQPMDLLSGDKRNKFLYVHDSVCFIEQF